MKYITIVLIVLVVFGFSGCGSYYQEVSLSEPHSIVKFKPFRLGQKVFPIEINGKAPNEFTKFSFTEFIVKPGKMTIFASTGEGNVAATTYLEFDAEVNQEYLISREVKLKSFIFNVKNNDKVILSREVPKQIQNRNSAYIPIFIY